jgi:hypothetical protein
MKNTGASILKQSHQGSVYTEEDLSAERRMLYTVEFCDKHISPGSVWMAKSISRVGI